MTLSNDLCKTILVTAITEGRAAELLDALFMGSAVTVDLETRKLIIISPETGGWPSIEEREAFEKDALELFDIFMDDGSLDAVREDSKGFLERMKAYKQKFHED